MAEAVIKSVLGKVGFLIAKEAGSFIGKELPLFLNFDRDLKRLDCSLTAIMATLEDAEEKQFSDRAIKDWLRKLKDAAHDLDDIMDEYAYEELRLEREGVKCCLPEMVLSSLLPSVHPMHVYFRYKIARGMKRVSERLDEIAEERRKFHLTETVLERRNAVADQRQTGPFITEPLVYGRGEEAKKIVDFLVGDSSHSGDLLVYPILGMGGLGKTTLAQLIYNHERIVKHFELRIWVCVSEDFSFKTMAKAIIGAASKRACEDLDLGLLHSGLQGLLQSKRYLLVLDDVWDDEQENWQMLKSVLVRGAKGASILVTARLSKVAEIMGTMPPCELSELSDNDCWELFKHRAFGPNEPEQVRLVAIGKEIVKKCRGVPLAAKALGGLLRFKREKNEWLYVKESNLLSLSHNENSNSIMPVLRLSYLNLPIKLRQCFAYCAIFPKDEQIEKQFLIDLWMANGFLSSNEILDVEDVGESVWNELYWRSFFQDICTDRFGKVVSFKMHDLVHDLAQFVAEEGCCIADGNDLTTLSRRMHHLSDLTGEAINQMQLDNIKSLRTYIGSKRGYYLSPKVLKCYYLRVLHREREIFFPSSIGDLKCLRYLNLSGGEFETLPESLCTLWNLQILKLNRCTSLKNLPNNLIHLKALRQLSLRKCDLLSNLPPHMGNLTSLRSLTTYIVGKERGFLLAELGALKLKGDLNIYNLEKAKSVEDAQEANMSSKQLKWLCLSWDRYDEEWELQENVEEILEALQPDTQQLECLIVKEYKGSCFPQWMFSPSLKRLDIRNCTKVEVLHEALQHMTALQELHLEYLLNLESLPDCFGNLPLLRKLYIDSCFKLVYLPASLSLSNLETLEIYYCFALERLCMSKTGEEWQKIAHIPQVIFHGWHGHLGMLCSSTNE